MSVAVCARRRVAPAVLLFALGCGGGAPGIVTDAGFARDVVDAVYAGSLAPVRGSLDPIFERAMPDSVAAAHGALLTDRFGAVAALQFQSTGQPNPSVTESIWELRAQGRDFEMKLWFHEEKLSGIWFRPSPAQEWAPVPQVGVEYSRQGKLPAGW